MPAHPATLTAAIPGIHPVPEASLNDANARVRELTRALADRNEAAFREFHAGYFDRLYLFALVVTRGNEHAARDAVQETMLRVVRHARTFDDADVFWCWLKAITRNAARDGGRKQRRYLAVLDHFTGWRTAAACETGAEDACVRAALDEALARLAADDRALIEGKYLRGLTVLELAELSGTTLKAVESRLVRLRRELHQAMLDELHRR